jgi:DeoR family transcriptional regulator of aga operon
MAHDAEIAAPANGSGPEPEIRVSAGLRRDRMLAVIKEREFIRVGELSERFEISAVTVRSDLDALASRGQIHRIRGGAIARSFPGQERPFEETETSFAAEKVAIGQAAAQLVADGETLLLDVGTTTVVAARALASRAELRDVVIFTNGLKTAFELESAIARFTVVVLGGTLRPLQHSLVDPLGSPILDHINVDTVFLGCNGVDPLAGITNINLPEAEVKKRMLKAAKRRVVLADGSKVGRVELAHLCPVDEIDLLITGESADEGVIAALRERGCAVQIVG